MKKNLPDLRPGDTVRVHQRIIEGNKSRIQIFEGLILAVRGGKSINSSFVVRYVHKGTRVGVEKTFPLHSPNIAKIERLKSSKVRQARLYYMRERFGRAGRMKGEAKNLGDWTESVEETSTENQDSGDKIQEPKGEEESDITSDAETEAVEAESVDSKDSEDQVQEPEIKSEEHSVEAPDTATTEAVSAESAKS